jgi:neutral ceramidase
MNGRDAWLALTLLVAVALSPARLQAEDPKPVFRAAAIAVDITPEQLPVDSAGSMSPRLAEHVHDRLMARCLVLDDGTMKIALVTCDSCLIPREVIDVAKVMVQLESDIAANRILCSATHTHTAVTTTSTFQSSVDQAYCKFLSNKIAEGIIAANKRLEPARVGWAVASNPRQVFNRRWFLRPGAPLADPFDTGTDKVRMNPRPNDASLVRPAGPTDPEIPVLAVQSLDGRPIAVWANYSLHYVGGVPAKSLSADYFGEFSRQFTALIGADEVEPAFVASMTNGTSADINNINFFEGATRREPFEQIRIVAADVAKSANVAYQRIVYHDWAPLKMVEEEIELGVRRPNAEDVARAKRLIEEAGLGPWRDRRLIYANETLALTEYPETVKAKLQAIRIGELGIVGTPCETFVETGLAVKKRSPLQPTFVIQLANGYNGYLPTPEQHRLGGYETWRARSSYLAVDAEPKVRKKLLELLDAVAK